MEVWREIENFEGLYEVSSFGSVRSLNRVSKRNSKTIRNLQSKVLKIQKYKNGYCFVCLSKNAVVKGFSIHRLVAKAFITNSLNKKEVNHIDEDKENNKVENLEWVTHKENINHGTAISRRVANSNFSGKNNPMFGRKGKLNKNSIKVEVYDLNENFVGAYDSIKEASDILKLNPSSAARVVKGSLRHTKEYVIRKTNNSKIIRCQSSRNESILKTPQHSN